MPISSLVHSVIEQCEPLKHFSLRIADTAEQQDQCITFREQLFFGHDSEKSDREARDSSALHIKIIDLRTDAFIGYLRLLSNAFVEETQNANSIDYYSSEYFVLEPLHQQFARSLEISRFCVLPQYRRQPAIFLIARQLITRLVSRLNIDVLFGLASFEQASITQHQAALSYLQWRSTQSILQQIVYSSHSTAFEPKPITHEEDETPPPLPPLLRFYLHFEPVFSQQAVLDHTFNSTLLFLHVTKDKLLSN